MGAYQWIRADQQAFYAKGKSVLGMEVSSATAVLGGTYVRYSPGAFNAILLKGGIGPAPPRAACDEVLWYGRGASIVLLYVSKGKVINVVCCAT